MRRPHQMTSHFLLLKTIQQQVVNSL
jgi:hypothetical protein